jgi:hypothetical protein
LSVIQDIKKEAKELLDAWVTALFFWRLLMDGRLQEVKRLL